MEGREASPVSSFLVPSGVFVPFPFPRRSLDLSCQSIADSRERGSWAYLRRTINSLLHHKSLPEIILQDCGEASIIAQRALRDTDKLGLSLPASGNVDTTCVLGRWAVSLLSRELLLRSSFAADVWPQLQRDGRSMGLILELEGTQGINSPLEAFLWAMRLPSQAPGWEEIGGSSWAIFALLVRVQRVFIDALRASGMTRYNELKFLRSVGRYSSAPRIVNVFQSASAILETVSRNSTETSRPWSELVSGVRKAEHLVHNWVANCVAENMSSGKISFVFSLFNETENFLHKLDKLFLPDAVLLRLPRAIRSLRGYANEEMADAAMWSGDIGSRFPHCRTSFGKGSMLAAAVRQRSLSSVFGGIDHVTRMQAWRTGIAMRTLGRRTMLSDNLHARCHVTCPVLVVQVLWEHGKAAAASVHSRILRVVDLGASLGDCVLIAAAVIPDGLYHGLAFEAHPEAAAVLRENIVLNGLYGQSLNGSTVVVRQVALGPPGDPGFIGISPSPDEPDVIVRSGTLDRELRNWRQTIDILTVNVRGAALQVLEGARNLLLAMRVKCALVYGKSKDTVDMLILFFSGLGYSTEIMPGHWLRASPAYQLLSSGGQICTPQLD